MPIKLAARGFFSLARNAEPINVFSKNQKSTIKSANNTARIHKLCEFTTAPINWIELLSTSGGNDFGDDPHIIKPIPFKNIDTPNVITTKTIGVALLAGLIANLSTNKPIIAVITIASGIAPQIGSPKLTNVTQDNAPIIANSPCAKFITPVTL